MKKTKQYNNVRFKAEALQEAYQVFLGLQTKELKEKLNPYRNVRVSGNEWKYDTDEEFFADYRQGASEATFDVGSEPNSFRFQKIGRSMSVSVSASARGAIERVFDVFEKHLAESTLPIETEPEISPTIFIGHGRSEQWRDLKDHLHEKHGYKVEAYEIGARAGHAIRDILEDMLKKSTFAILVMTGEDLDAEGKLHARENVIHELGLFQGHLGFNKAIVVLENGTTEFSNIHGINQVRYSKGSIKETFGEILATLRREFQTSQK